MAGRRVSTAYPQPPNLERTYRRSRTLLGGVRHFLAAEGIVPFADDKNGVARIGGDVWLRPSATRQIGNFLDLNPPALAGFRLRPDPLHLSLAVASGSLFDEFIKVAEGMTRSVVDTTNQLRLQGCTHCGGEWPWEGHLAYEHTVTIDGGERIFNEPHIPLHVREAADGSVLIAVVLRHAPEFDAAKKWLNACQPANHGWLLSPVRLNEEPPQRHDEFFDILTGLGDEFLIARNPSMSARERTAASEAAETTFRDFIESVPYRTRPLDWKMILDRLNSDDVSLGGITAYVWAKRNTAEGRANSAIIALDLRQRPGQDDHLRLSWNTGRVLPNRERPSFSEALLQDLPLLDWDEELKVRYLLTLWDGIAAAGQLPAAAPGTGTQAAGGEAV